MLAQQFVNAISLGGVYALFALGFTLVFGVLNVVNLAHGAVFMLGAYAALQGVVLFRLPILAAIVLAMAVTALVGWALDRMIFAPLRARQAPHLAPMIATIGVAITLTSVVEGLFGAENLRFPMQILPSDAVSLGRRANYLAGVENHFLGLCADGDVAVGFEEDPGRLRPARPGRIAQSGGASRRQRGRAVLRDVDRSGHCLAAWPAS